MPVALLAAVPGHGDCPPAELAEVQVRVPGRVRVLEKRLAAEMARREAAEADLQRALDALDKARLAGRREAAAAIRAHADQHAPLRDGEIPTAKRRYWLAAARVAEPKPTLAEVAAAFLPALEQWAAAQTAASGDPTTGRPTGLPTEETPADGDR